MTDVSPITDMNADGTVPDPTAYVEIVDLESEPVATPDAPGVRELLPELDDDALNDSLARLREQRQALAAERARTREVAHAAVDESVDRAANRREQLLEGWVESIRRHGYSMLPPELLGSAEAGMRAGDELHALIDRPSDRYTSRPLVEVDADLADLAAEIGAQEHELEMRGHRRTTAAAKLAEESAAAKLAAPTPKGK